MKISAQDVAQAAVVLYRLDPKEFYSPSTARRVSRPRQIAMAVSRKMTPESLQKIGYAFGRDHSSVAIAVRKTNKRAGKADVEQAQDAVALIAVRLFIERRDRTMALVAAYKQGLRPMEAAE